MKKTTVLWGAPTFWIERFPLLYGVEKRIFQRLGVCPEVKVHHGGPELLQAVRDNRAHVGEIGLPPFLTAFSHGLPARIIGSTFIRSLDHFLVAKPAISSLAELKGRRIGILSRGSCDEYFIRRLLQNQGIDPDKEATLVPLGSAYGDSVCFTGGRIDAGFMVEPALSSGESKGFFHVLARVGDFFPRYQWGGIFAADSWIQDNRDLLTALMEGYRQTVRLMYADPQACAALGSQLFGVDPAVFRSALNRHLPNLEPDAQIDLEGLENCIRIQMELGAIPGQIQPEEIIIQF
ncbi:MAG: ABC transporter substrate-binding protein [Desulfatirhabdiaceae bacterium]|nr:ABC transporter substrate-binding protein [Desulfatirhabdiaceae bacterium]